MRKTVLGLFVVFAALSLASVSAFACHGSTCISASTGVKVDSDVRQFQDADFHNPGGYEAKSDFTQRQRHKLTMTGYRRGVTGEAETYTAQYFADGRSYYYGNGRSAEHTYEGFEETVNTTAIGPGCRTAKINSSIDHEANIATNQGGNSMIAKIDTSTKARLGQTGQPNSLRGSFASEHYTAYENVNGGNWQVGSVYTKVKGQRSR